MLWNSRDEFLGSVESDLNTNPKRCFSILKLDSKSPSIPDRVSTPVHPLTQVIVPCLFFSPLWELCSSKARFQAREGAICTVCNGWSRGQKNEQQNNIPNPKKQCCCRLSWSRENGAFKRCSSTVGINTNLNTKLTYSFKT